MHCSRNFARSPSVIRVVRPGAAYTPARNASFFPAPFFTRFQNPAVSFGNEMAPFFKLMDEISAPASFPQIRNTVAYQPRFDVREVGETYELRGELPGVEGKDIEVKFTDAQTLIIRGRTERESSSGTPPTAAPVTEDQTTKAVTEAAEADNNSDAASTYSTGSYQKPSVEDEEGAAPDLSSDAAAKATPAGSVAEQQQQPEKTTDQTEQKQPSSHYWVSERTTGSFQRVFKFPSRVDQDAVKASLKNGILSIVVPKAVAPAARRINVE